MLLAHPVLPPNPRLAKSNTYQLAFPACSAGTVQLGLEDVETALRSLHAASDAAVPKSNGEHPRKINRGALPAYLKRSEQVVDVEEKTCPCCGCALHWIGEDVAERLDVVPTTFRVLIISPPRYGCRSCENAVVQAPAPARIIGVNIPSEALIRAAVRRRDNRIRTRSRAQANKDRSDSGVCLR